jgi:hypothetical protein
MKRTAHRHESASPNQARILFRSRFALDASTASAARVKMERWGSGFRVLPES